ARSNRVEQEFDGRGRTVSSDENRRMIRVEVDGSDMTMLAARAAERLDPAAAVRSGHPVVGGPELERGQLRLRSDCIEGREQLRRIDAIQRHALPRLRVGYLCI